jgi:hypothetical protein
MISGDRTISAPANPPIFCKTRISDLPGRYGRRGGRHLPRYRPDPQHKQVSLAFAAIAHCRRIGVHQAQAAPANSVWLPETGQRLGGVELAPGVRDFDLDAGPTRCSATLISSRPGCTLPCSRTLVAISATQTRAGNSTSSANSRHLPRHLAPTSSIQRSIAAGAEGRCSLGFRCARSA